MTKAMMPHIYSPVKFIPLSPRTMVRLKRLRDDSTSVVHPIVHGSGQIGSNWALTVDLSGTEAHCLCLDGYAPDENVRGIL